jgi:hypothetical protein
MCEIQFEILLLSLLFRKLLLPTLNHPLLTLSYWPSVSITLSTKLIPLSKTVQYCVIQGKETNIVFKMKVFCDEEDTKQVILSLFTYLGIPIFYGLLTVSINCPQSLALHECVVSLTLHLL